MHNYIELRGVSWCDIMVMPYKFFIDDLKWKVDYEEDKRKRIEEARLKSSNSEKKQKKRKKQGARWFPIFNV